MQIINCTYRGPAILYLVSELYPYYTEDYISTQLQVLPGRMYEAIRELPVEAMQASLGVLSGQLREVFATYSAEVESFTASLLVQPSVLQQVLQTHTQPTEPSETVQATLDVLSGSSLLEVLITHTQPEEAVFTHLTVLDGTLV